MRLDWAILSNSAEVQGNLSYILGGGWDTGWRPQFPAPFLGALTLRLQMHRTEVSEPHRIEIRFVEEDGREFNERFELTVPAGRIPPEHPMGWELPASVALGLQGLTIPHEGKYSLEILIDGHHFRSLPFRFVRGGPPGAT